MTLFSAILGKQFTKSYCTPGTLNPDPDLINECLCEVEQVIVNTMMNATWGEKYAYILKYSLECLSSEIL